MDDAPLSHRAALPDGDVGIDQGVGADLDLITDDAAGHDRDPVAQADAGADKDQGGNGDLLAQRHFRAQIGQIADTGPAPHGGGKQGRHPGVGQIGVGHDDQGPRQPGVFLGYDKGGGAALIRQAGEPPLGDEGDLPGRGLIQGGNALNGKIGGPLEFSSQKGRQLAQGVRHEAFSRRTCCAPYR